MNIAADKFEQFEWLTHGITAKSPNFEPQPHGTGEKPLNYEDRLGAIASMDTQLAKSVTAIIVFDGKCESDYEYVRNHLVKIYRKTWKPYENLMCLALESVIDEASQAIQKYKKNTYKEMRV